MITVKIGEQTYELPSMDDALSSLTGDESLMIEDYLGGFDRLGSQTTKGAVVMVWLALRSAGESKPLTEIQALPGLLFGDVINDDGKGEPEDPMKDPGRPLVGRNEQNGSSAGDSDSEAIPHRSESIGTRP